MNTTQDHSVDDRRSMMIILISVLVIGGVLLLGGLTLCFVFAMRRSNKENKKLLEPNRSSNKLATSAQRYHFAKNMEKQLESEKSSCPTPYKNNRLDEAEDEEVYKFQGLSKVHNFEVKNPFFSETLKESSSEDLEELAKSAKLNRSHSNKSDK
ncbi:hypothetical protein Ciccas_005160 [Cichlidogyrus casuarinus]|uniref:Uncharacterized protein n=1 Tax=Cichlidogyrus casuarinus TaxID=1844966 RepID=A0ABD2Q9F4_9PLAT